MKHPLLAALLAALLCLSCSGVAADSLPVSVRCRPTYRVDIPTRMLNPDDCWRVTGLSGSQVTDVDGDCENPVACLVTPASAIWRVDRSPESQGNVRWEEVACSAGCD